MKKSVYVPDDLWAKFEAVDPSANLSQLVQETLRDRFEAKPARPAYATLNAELETHRAERQAAARAQVADAYQAGYEFGLNFTEGLVSEAYLLLVASDYDFQAFDDATKNEEIPLPDEDNLFYDFKLHWEGTVEDTSAYFFSEYGWERLPAVVREGLVDALRDVWEGAGLAEVPGPERSPSQSGLRVVAETEVVDQSRQANPEQVGPSHKEGGAPDA